MNLQKILLATTNPGKIREFKEFFSNCPLEIITLDQLGKSTDTLRFTETGKSFTANAELKAQYFGKLSGLAAVADDSGLEIAALGGKPGIFSRRLASTDALKINKILTLMRHVPQGKRTARFVAVIALYRSDIDETVTFTGIAEGQITHTSQGSHGFGYDPIFFSNELKKTFSQVDLKTKNQVSHRAKALTLLKNYLA